MAALLLRHALLAPPPAHASLPRRLRLSAAFPAARSMASSAPPSSNQLPAVVVQQEHPSLLEFAKTFDFTAEEHIYNWWESHGYFKPRLDNGVDPFVISMPPPNVTGALHMGHAMFVTLEDIMIRHWRMRGKPTLWVPGTDHAGIATQLVVEKMLASQGLRKSDLTRDEFLAKILEWKTKSGRTITNQLRRLGASCDWSREHFTLDKQLSEAVIEAFVRLHQKGLLYKGFYMVNWSPKLQTAISDLEVEYTEEPGTLYYLKYPVSGGGMDDFLPIATTRPETLFGDTAIAVHPKDGRYIKFVGKKATVPMSNGREIPIVADEFVDRSFGTGALKVTPGHDPNDYSMGQKLGLQIINIMNNDGTLNENAGVYCGLDRFIARKKLWADIEAAGLALKQEPYSLRVPRSQRGGEIVEPLVCKQWFISMEPLARTALQVLEEGQIKIIPERFGKTYKHWLSNIKDWCISRQLSWGHQIPVWYLNGTDDHSYIVARSEEDAYVKAREMYGDAIKLQQDSDVLDTWFSSALWPFSTLGWPDTAAEDFVRFYPTTVLETGHDILFFWVARMVMMGIELTGTVPFSTVYLHGLVRDSQGRKMSKTLGNVVDPLDSIKEYGTDALRFTLATGSTPGQDINLSTERLNANKAFTNKLWNAGRFILQSLSTTEKPLHVFDSQRYHALDDIMQLPLCEKWIVSKLHALVDDATRSYESFSFGEAGRAIYDFFWSDFADWYIEASKTRLYKNEDIAAISQTQSVLLYVFNAVLRLLHPLMPFVSEQIWQGLFQKDGALVVAQWPECKLPRIQDAVQNFETIQSLIRAIRNARAEYSVEPARRISAIIVATEGARSIMEETAVLVSLSKLDATTLKITDKIQTDASNAVHVVVSENLEAYLPLSDMIDVEAEINRLSKQAAKLQSEYNGLIERLSSSNFVEKAPDSVVQGIRDKASETEEKLRLIRKQISLLHSMLAPPEN